MKRALIFIGLSTCALSTAAQAQVEYSIALKSDHGRFVGTYPDRARNAESAPEARNRLTLLDLNGGDLVDGDPVAVRDMYGRFLTGHLMPSPGFNATMVGADAIWNIRGLGKTHIVSGGRIGLHNALYNRNLQALPDTTMSTHTNLLGWEQFDLYIFAASNTANGEQRDERGTNFCYTADNAQIILETERSLLSWQGDGNLVLYDRNHCAGADRHGCSAAAARWATGTNGRGRNVCFWADGNFGIQGEGGAWLWRSYTEGAAFKTANGHFLRAASGGGAGLHADAAVNELHERFDLIESSGGTTALRAHTNRHYVVAEATGDANANRTAIGTWEQMYIENNNDGTYSIFSPHHERYLRAVNGGGDDARFDRSTSESHERFVMLIADKLVLEDCKISIRNAEQALWSAGYDCSLLGDPAPLGPAPFERNAGNHSFGSGLNVQLGYQSPMPGYTRAFGMAAAYARVFGRELTIVAAKGEARTVIGAHSASAEFTVLGVDQAVGLPDAEDPVELLPPVERTFIERQQTFMAGPFPLTVTGTATGIIGMQGHATPGASGFTVTVRPYANLSGSAAVSVGIVCVQAGIRGTLTLLELGFPATVALDAAARTVDVGASIELETLSGSVELFAEACGLSESWPLVEWDGIDQDWALFPTQRFTY